MDSNLQSAILSLVGLAAGAIFKDTIFGFFGFAKKTEEKESEQSMKVSLLEQRFIDFQTNHAVHQTIIEKYMENDAKDKQKIFVILTKLATKEGVDIQI